jgi:asparagine synthase (glutamine-hydrolysing)
MSGIVGLLNLDGAPVDRRLLRRLTDALAFHGPDGSDVWAEGAVGLGHTLLATTWESHGERQPCSLDGRVWVAADARVDGRDELLAALRSAGREVPETATDAALILHAYHAWEEDCVGHLLGDFAFAVWDGRRRRLFCARDHFGIKPFYYAVSGEVLVWSNTLNCVRAHPAVSDRLNDQALGDFLVFGFNQEPATTTFADVRRLPPGHCLTWTGGEVRLRRYWTLPTDGHVRYRRKTDYVDHFREVLGAAVKDRLRTDRVGVFMSGGLDSTAVAAVARDHLCRRGRPFDLRAYTAVFDRLIPDRERHYAGLAARALGIPVEYLAGDDCRPYRGWDRPELRTPEPVDDALAALSAEQFRQALSHGRVVLTGYGGDPVLYPSPMHLLGLLKRGRLVRWAAEVGGYLLTHGRLPPLGLRTQLRRWFGKRGGPPPLPAWLEPGLAARLDLAGRWCAHHAEAPPAHPTHPAAYRNLVSPYWPYLFEWYDPGFSLCPLEFRQPFFDIRLVNYVLSVPPMPWCVDKELLRQALRGALPESVRLRPKTPLAGDPLRVLLERGVVRWADHFRPAPGLARYVDPQRVLRIAR